MFKKVIPWLLMLLGGVFLFSVVLQEGQEGFCEEREVMIIDLEGPINPGTATFMVRGIEEAEERGSVLVIIRLDTPGGLATSMRTMVKAILNSSVPVVVYVAPSGAGAASAGVMSQWRPTWRRWHRGPTSALPTQ